MSEQEVITCTITWLIGFLVAIYLLGRKGEDFYVACIIAAFWPSVVLLFPIISFFEFIHKKGAAKFKANNDQRAPGDN